MSALTTDTGTTTDGELRTVAPLNAFDRCDNCGAQAYIRVELNGGGELLFCAHHGREVKDKLEPIALSWHDESARLLED